MTLRASRSMTTALKLCVLESSPRKSLAMWHKLYKTPALGECKLLLLTGEACGVNTVRHFRITIHASRFSYFLLLNRRARTKPAAPHPGLQRRSAHRTGAARVRGFFPEELFRRVSTGRGAQRLPRQHARRGAARGEGFSGGQLAGFSRAHRQGRRADRRSQTRRPRRHHRLCGRRRRDRAGGGAAIAAAIWNRRTAWSARAGCRAACC